MQVIEALRASILEPHDHLHISQMRTFTRSTPMHKHTVGYLARRSLLREAWLFLKGTSARLISRQVLDSAAPAVTRPL
jgi:hypothetical protein